MCIIRVTRHAKRAVLACCERAITFVPVFPWRVTNSLTVSRGTKSETVSEFRTDENQMFW